MRLKESISTIRIMTRRYTPATDQRRAAIAERLRRLKMLTIGVSMAVALGIWTMVTGAVDLASAQAAAAQPAVTFSQQSFGFFNGGSSLGSGISRAPVMRSHGS